MNIICATMNFETPYFSCSPIIKININMQVDGKTIMSGYLAPHKQETFMVSESDYLLQHFNNLSSPKYEFKNIISSMDERTAKGFLNGCAIPAVQGFISQTYNDNEIFLLGFPYRYYPPAWRKAILDKVISSNDNDTTITSSNKKSQFKNLKNWSEFIDMCYDWIKG